MKTFRSLLLSASLVSSSSLLGAADAPAVLSGVLVADGKTRVALTDPATKATAWTELGGEFNGWSVTRYDAAEEAVFLRKGGEEVRLGLVLPKTEPAAPNTTVGATPTPAADASTVAAGIRANLRRLVEAAQQLRAERGVTSVSYGDLVGPGKPIPELTPLAGESYATLNFSADLTAIAVTTVDGATVALQLTPAGPLHQGAPFAPPAPTPAPEPAANATSIPTPTGRIAPPVSGAIPPAPVPATTTPATTGGQPVTLPGTESPRPPASAANEPLPSSPRQPPSPSYTIQGGDTLQSIATANGVTVQQLQQLNPTLHGSSLQPGETIRIR